MWKILLILLLKVMGLIISGVIIHQILLTLYIINVKDSIWKGRLTIKRFIKRVRYRIRKIKYIKPLELIKWVLIDIIEKRDRSKLYGLWVFTGYFGEGKTLGAVKYAKMLKEKYPEKNIKLVSNFNMKGQYKKITSWQDIIDLPKNTIIIFDEIQSTFTSQRFKEFPIELLWKLTQCRKHGLMVLCTAPVFARMTIQLRENTDFVIRCKNVLGLDRLFSYDFYRASDYERFSDNPVKLRLFRYMSLSFVASNYDFRLYDTYEIVERIDIQGNNTNTKKIEESNIIKRLENYKSAK